MKNGLAQVPIGQEPGIRPQEVGIRVGLWAGEGSADQVPFACCVHIPVAQRVSPELLVLPSPALGGLSASLGDVSHTARVAVWLPPPSRSLKLRGSWRL